jgi:hypothetical protein
MKFHAVKDIGRPARGQCRGGATAENAGLGGAHRRAVNTPIIACAAKVF